MRKLVAYRNNQVAAHFWRWIAKKGDRVNYFLVDQIPTFHKAEVRAFIVDITSKLVEVTGPGILQGKGPSLIQILGQDRGLGPISYVQRLRETYVTTAIKLVVTDLNKSFTMTKSLRAAQ